jgi:hypothetical protein
VAASFAIAQSRSISNSEAPGLQAASLQKSPEIRRSCHLARPLLKDCRQGKEIFQGEFEMTNLQSIGGSMVWMAVAAALLLVTFEPVSPGEQAPELQRVAAKSAPAAQA